MSDYKLSDLIQSKIDNKELKIMIRHGFAYHHGGLTDVERSIIERAFRAGIVKVLFCTSTLAAGVNLPAKRVIITSLMQGMAPLTDTMYKQMVGRAGRYGLDDSGDSFLV